MRAYLVNIFLLFVICQSASAVEIAVNIGEVKREEEKKPELPALPSLTISVVNLSFLDMTVAVKASEKDSQTHVIVVQNTVAKNTSMTLGKYFSPLPDAVFKLQEYSIIFTYVGLPSQRLDCTLPTASPPEDQTAAPAAGAASMPDIKKSISIFVYTPSDMLWPKCIMYFDS